VFDLIAAADDHGDWQPDSVEPFRDVFDHAALGPGALGLGRAALVLTSRAKMLMRATALFRRSTPTSRAIGQSFVTG
jgi:hypothetical protein